MALSYDAYPADGVTTQFDLTFGYLSRSHVFVFVDDVLRSYRWINGTRVELNLAPDPGQTVRVQRLTDRVTRVTDFVDGQTLLAGDLDAGDLQNFYILQEIADQVADGVLTGSIPVATASGSANGGFVTEQWINEQLESNAYTTQAYIQLLQQITDEEIARAQAIAAEASARAAEIAQEATDRANAITAEATTRAQEVLALTNADLAAGQRLDALESTVDTPATGLSAKIATLETVTTDLENNKAEASVVTAIQSDLDDPTTGLKVRATSLEDRTTAVENGKADTSVTDLLDTEINDPTTGLKSRATSLENRATTLENGKAEASALDLLDSQVNDPVTGLDARATSLENRTTNVENNKADGSVVSAISSDLNALEAQVQNPTTGLDAKASVIQLNDAVAAESGARTSQINSANSRIDDVEADVTQVTQTQANDNQARIDDISDLGVKLSSNSAAQGIIIQNPYFRDDPIGSTAVPTDWANGSGTGLMPSVIAEHPDYPGLPCYELTKPDGTGSLHIRSNAMPCVGSETFKVRARVALVSSSTGGWGGAGVFLQARTAASVYINNPVAFRFGGTADVLGNVNAAPELGKEYVYETEVTVPAGAGEFLVFATGNYSGFSGYTTSGEWVIRWYEVSVERVSALSGRVSDAQADATSALSLVATEEASRISEVSRLDVQFRADVNSQNLVKNSKFSMDPEGYIGLPRGWAGWANGQLTEIRQSAFDADRLVAYMDAPVDVAGRGFLQRLYEVVPGQAYTLTATVRRRGGSFTASGVHTSCRNASNVSIGVNNLDFDADASLDGQTGAYKDGTVTFSKTIIVPAGTVELIVYAMAAWNGFGSNATGVQIDWYEVSVTPVDASVQTGIDAKATADSNTQLISNETAARASALDSLEAQYRSEMARHNLIPGPYRIMTEAAWMADPKMVRLYNANLYGTGIQNPWTSTDALKFDSNAGDARLAFTPDLGTDFFNRPDRLGVVMEAGRSYAGKIDVQISATHTNVALFARGNDDGGLYTIVSGTPNGGRQTLNGIFTPTVTQKYSFELRVLSPSGQINNWIYRMQVTRLFPGEIAYDVPWIDDEADTTSEAAVKVLKDALATGSASQARLFMGVNTSNNEAFLEAYAGEGDGVWNGSKIKLKADFFEFDGTAVFNQGALSAAGTAVNFTVSGTAPSSPVDGEWWADSVGGSLYIRLAGAWQLISNISLDNAFRLTGAPVVIAEAPTSSASATATTGTPGIAAVNAAGTVTYAWYRVGGDASIACSNTATANPTWSGVPGAVPSTKDAAWRCVATDAATGDTAIFDTIVRLTNLF